MTRKRTTLHKHTIRVLQPRDLRDELGITSRAVSYRTGQMVCIEIPVGKKKIMRRYLPIDIDRVVAAHLSAL